MIIQPGTAFAATAYMGPPRGSEVGYQREKGSSIAWMTFAHELGHNLGLDHAGGIQSDGRYEEYQDDALMGYQRDGRVADFNAVARYKLGWVSPPSRLNTRATAPPQLARVAASTDRRLASRPRLADPLN